MSGFQHSGCLYIQTHRHSFQIPTFFSTSQCKLSQQLRYGLSVFKVDKGENEQKKGRADGEAAENGKKGAVSCGWHPDRVVYVRNGFPEAPERSRQYHYDNATVWQTACSASALTNACCQAGTCHNQTQTHIHMYSESDRPINAFYALVNEQARQAPYGAIQKVKINKI